MRLSIFKHILSSRGMKFTQFGEIIFNREDEKPSCYRCSKNKNFPFCVEDCGGITDHLSYQRVVPIVFCGNCEHHGKRSCHVKDWNLTANNDFCAWGTPKGQED